ncbi:hypothetical protein QCE62_19815 [Caballeronia sp. LZ033]|uniref:hypothetical protein n=1 Tax=Caballeronia sp. LZ033 TaxID=3038566 RepID=UPI00285FE46A|nr:hypothetical protein [Caballeronia sp. LZ033]MDR5815838.1 hypothetical protein [Caballeronia sp. LZ033]
MKQIYGVDMPNKSYVRNGHHININVTEVKGGRWNWDYTIDALNYTALRERPAASEGGAMLEAENDANHKADNLPPGDA